MKLPPATNSSRSRGKNYSRANEESCRRRRSTRKFRHRAIKTRPLPVIAQWLSSHGVTVILRDVGREQLDRGLAIIEQTYADAVKRGLMSEEKAKEGRARIVASAVPIELRDVQVVIEAASEKIDIKKE